MKNIRKAVIAIVCLLICAHTFAGENDKGNIDYILVLNAYTESTPWSNNLIYPIVKMASQNKEIGVYTEHLNMLMLDDESELKAFEEDMFRNFAGERPLLVVLIGTETYILCEDLNRKWPDIPMILCGERDYTGPKNKILTGQALASDEHLSLRTWQEKYNLTLMPIHIYMEENLQLMKQLIPEMKKVLYIGDETYICQQNDYDLSQLIAEKHPELDYHFLSAGNISIDSLFSILNRVEVRETGVLFSSWFRKNVYADNTVLLANSHRIIATSSVPLFAFKNVGIEEEGGIVGGYIINYKDYIGQLLKTIEEIRAGRPARDIPFFYISDGAPVFNYQSLLQWNLDPKLCPPNTIFYSMPPTFWEEYKYAAIGFLFFLVFLFIAFQYHRLRVLGKIKIIQQKELQINARYQDLINNMPILYMFEELIKDEKGQVVETKFVDVNRYFESKFVKRESIIGKLGSEIFPESMSEFLHFMNIALREKRSITFSYYYKSVDTFFDIVLNTSDEGRFMDIFCIDSTELHHAQMQLSSTNRKLSMALDVASIVPWKWDLQSHQILCDVNKPIELSSDNNKVKEEQLSVPDSQYFSKIYREDLEKVKRAYADLIEGRTTKVKEEYRVINRVNGHHQIDWVEAQAAVETWDEQGRPLTLVGSSLIITERKKIEEELLSAKDQAEESNRLKSAFLANMSHEIRTPLNAIVGFSGILASTEEEKEKQEYVSIIENNNALLLQLVSDILDLSKIEAGTMEFIYTDFELNRIMTELENSLRLKLNPEKDVVLLFEPGLAECYIHSDRNRLSQLIINLVTNAIKFTDSGSVRFGYKLREGSELYFYVTDTGCGIPEEKQKSIFGRFVKLNNFAQGTGLGLSICQMLVQHMGGKIGVESKPGEGSHFWFTIPHIAPKNKLQEEDKIEPLKMEKKTLTILVAEDNASNYKLIESILKKDYNLIHAWNGREAVEMFRKHAPQLILMDINMPEMNGYEATREIRKLSSRIPIIAVTAFAYASDEQKAMENGFDDYMPKPINAHQLRNKVMSILQRHIVFM